uniref:Uncharacterized protein n=1 Tax=Amphimedon queenslandica TaxID=400682 RepID=A0A1X7VGA5_AMPQE
MNQNNQSNLITIKSTLEIWYA